MDSSFNDMDDVVVIKESIGNENIVNDNLTKKVNAIVCADVVKKADNISYPESSDVIHSTDAKRLEYLRNELEDILQQQDKLEKEKKEILNEIEELFIELRNDFYMRFYNKILSSFKIKDNIMQCICEKDFNDYLEVIVKQLKNGTDKKIILADEMLFENLIRLIEATGIKVNKDDLETPELLIDICDEACITIKNFRLKN